MSLLTALVIFGDFLPSREFQCMFNLRPSRTVSVHVQFKPARVQPEAEAVLVSWMEPSVMALQSWTPTTLLVGSSAQQALDFLRSETELSHLVVDK